jgi:Asp/Glu/hydantoin racemase
VPEAEADARLIAAAPDPLAALAAIRAALSQPVQYTGIRN